MHTKTVFSKTVNRLLHIPWVVAESQQIEKWHFRRARAQGPTCASPPFLHLSECEGGYILALVKCKTMVEPFFPRIFLYSSQSPRTRFMCLSYAMNVPSNVRVSEIWILILQLTYWSILFPLIWVVCRVHIKNVNTCKGAGQKGETAYHGWHSHTRLREGFDREGLETAFRVWAQDDSFPLILIHFW